MNVKKIYLLSKISRFLYFGVFFVLFFLSLFFLYLSFLGNFKYNILYALLICFFGFQLYFMTLKRRNKLLKIVYNELIRKQRKIVRSKL